MFVGEYDLFYSMNNYEKLLDYVEVLSTMLLSNEMGNRKLSQLMRLWDYDTYRIGKQRRLIRDCASAQSCQSLCCSHTLSMEVDVGSDQK